MIHGVLNIEKEKGYTSHDVVAKLRGILGQKKIGHTGTLDPDATGVLPVCLGKATKLCDMLTDKSKTYETVMLLGRVTDTQDITGAVLSECATDHLDSRAVKTCIGEFVGDYLQIPPMYSALKVNGKKLYELARQGIEVERKARPVVIHQIRILEMNLPRVRMEVSCSKGTYIRTLCHDIGQKLGCGACMEELIRTRVGCFTKENSVTLKEVKERKEAGQLKELVIPIDALFSEYDAVTVKKEFETLLYNGNPFLSKHLRERFYPADGKQVRVYDEEGCFIGIYAFDESRKMFQVVKMFFDKNG